MYSAYQTSRRERGAHCEQQPGARLYEQATMDRLFGKPKEKAPRPTLQGATETMEKRGEKQDDRTVSYTHLTLPTSAIV